MDVGEQADAEAGERRRQVRRPAASTRVDSELGAARTRVSVRAGRRSDARRQLADAATASSSDGRAG